MIDPTVVILIATVLFLFWGLYGLNPWFNGLFWQMRGYSKIQVTEYEKYGGNTWITFTRDGKTAPIYTLHPNIGDFRLNEDGNAAFMELNFNSFTWKYL